jgi:hypothetical protein
MERVIVLDRNIVKSAAWIFQPTLAGLDHHPEEGWGSWFETRCLATLLIMRPRGTSLQRRGLLPPFLF